MITILAKNTPFYLPTFLHNCKYLRDIWFFQDRKLFPDTYRRFDIVKKLKIKVNNSFALHTPKVLIAIQILVKAALAFHFSSLHTRLCRGYFDIPVVPNILHAGSR